MKKNNLFAKKFVHIIKYIKGIFNSKSCKQCIFFEKQSILKKFKIIKLVEKAEKINKLITNLLKSKIQFDQ